MRDRAKSLVSYRNRFNADHIVKRTFGSDAFSSVQFTLPLWPCLIRVVFIKIDDLLGGTSVEFENEIAERRREQY